MTDTAGTSLGKRNRLDVLVGLGITFLLACLFFIPWNGFEISQGKLYDLALRIRGGKAPPQDMAIVAIDDSSISQVGRWPWPRRYVAQLIDQLTASGARVVALDLLFPPVAGERDAGDDRLLGEAVRRAGNVVGSYYFKMGKPEGRRSEIKVPPAIMNSAFLLFDDPNRFLEFPPPSAQEIFAPIPEVATGFKSLGHVNIFPDLDGKVRREPLLLEYGGNYFPSFSLQVAANATGLSRAGVAVKVGQSIRLGRKMIPTSADGMMLISYYGGTGSVPHYSCTEVLSGKVGKEKLQGRIILVGVTASGVSSGVEDFVATPFSNRLPGVEKQAQVVAALMDSRFLDRPSWTFFTELALVLVLGMILSLVLPRARGVLLFLLPLAILLGLGALTVGYLYKGVWISVLFPALLVVLHSLWVPVGRAMGVSGPTVPERESGVLTVHESIEPALDGKTLRLPAEASPSGKKLGRYEILEEIGQGGMGVVYKGRDPIIDRLVAIKTIRFDRLYEGNERKSLKERFFVEARAAGKLIHPHIVTIFDVGEDGGVAYIAMEYVEGTTLGGYVARDRLLPVEDAVQSMIETAMALDFAHQQGIIHRDVKPSNIMRTGKGPIKVMDFGIAKLPTSTLTQAGSIMGTPSYMSPEQIHGWPIDGRSDLFALGCVLYELLTGAKPFRGEDFSALVQQITEEIPLPPSQENSRVPLVFDELLKKALAKAKEERFQNGQEMARCLRDAIRKIKE